jgi:hypothetical protein
MIKEKDETLFDLRILELNLREGKFKPKDYESYLKSLPNSESNAEYIEVFEEETPSEENTMPEGQLAFSMAETHSK